jgi:hypothetical protein
VERQTRVDGGGMRVRVRVRVRVDVLVMIALLCFFTGEDMAAFRIKHMRADFLVSSF